MQFKIPDVEMEKLQQAETEEAQRQILERFAQDLPVTNRTIKGGSDHIHNENIIFQIYNLKMRKLICKDL